ncbi:ABC transporter ATP-binding protein [Acaricomes phytoseiuli]|uniref:ABC transporter ATP-binding protein n=1 Tax=Acaricomes phytoseiuli TaxID=291968 RepID=UPI00222237A0|nr:ABC transporter ATP-binding protein [Acaricomes phytoseiuli]MCW1249916.1 ABC transporter ATP-binding protein [Acaricomes phytoseiuli]
MLITENLRVKGRHHDLVPPTSLQASTGSLLLITADNQTQRTALALALSARMKPDAGMISWDRQTDLKKRRRKSALIDSPDVNEPEQHLSVRQLAAEDLALIPRRHRGARSTRDWLTVNAFVDIADEQVLALPPRRRLALLCTTALADPGITLMIADSPDRHGLDPAIWLDYLQALATNPGRPLCVIAIVAQIPQNWAGPSARLVNPVAPDSETVHPESQED